MKDFDKTKKYGALVPFGKRVDHTEDAHERRLRELGAAFNRMSSASDAEAHSAFERARHLIEDIGSHFDAVWKASCETAILQTINKDLGQQLKHVLQENAKYRAMRISYRLKGDIVRIMRLSATSTWSALPFLAVLGLYARGWVEAGNAAWLLVPIGFYNSARGLTTGSGNRILFGILVILSALTANSVVARFDQPAVLQRQLELIQNMNHDHVLGPRTFFIDYPISKTTLITTVLGIGDTLKITVGDNAQPREISCAKYYARDVRVPRYAAMTTSLPDKPDIFHSKPIAMFGDCELYEKLMP